MTTATSRRESGEETQPGPAARRVVLAVAVSLDGYIARPNGAVDWLIEDREIDLDLRAYGEIFDVIVAGRKTLDYPEDQKGTKGSASPWGKMECYIFSRSKAPGKRGGVKYVTEAPSEFIRRIRAHAGKDIWLMGGGELAREFLKEDLVDGMDLGIMPVLLGEGIPLFPPSFPQRNFVLEEFKTYKSGIVKATYSRATSKRREAI